MSVTETIGALGTWSVALLPETPQSILDQLRDRSGSPAYFGHIAIHLGQLNPSLYGDNLLKSSRFTGVYRSFAQDGTDTPTISGPGMSMWLGDEDQKGAVIEALSTITGQSFVATIRSLLPTSVHEGTLFTDVPGTFTGTFQYIDPRSAIDYVCTTMGAEYRVNGDGTLDAGLVSDLYRTIPTVAVVAKDAGVDMNLRALLGEYSTAEDVNDFTTRVLLLAQGDGSATATGSADISGGLNPYKDIFGNVVKMTRMVSESGTDTGNATVRAQLNLNQFTSTRDALTLDTSEYDIKGDIVVGDNLYVYDPAQQLVDNTQEIVFRGAKINPITLRCTESTWPVTDDMSVAFRTPAGVWVDLTPYVIAETGTSTIVVGGYNRSLVSTSEPVGSRPVADSSVPGVPTWTTPFVQGVYQSPVNGQTRAQAQLVWTEPLNTDGTNIIDGDHYEIRYRQSSTPVFPVEWQQVESMTWAQLETAQWQNPITYPVGNWQNTSCGFDQLRFMIEELVPSHPYEAQIRAVDGATPPNYGDWSTVTTWQTSDDTIPPATPAAPIVDSSLIAIQVTHYLGVATGGDFNLDVDLHHLEIHGEYEPLFTPSDSTMLGKLVANNGMITGEIPAVGTFQVDALVPTYFKVIAVDTAGNKSLPSDSDRGTPDLIDDAHISSLTVSKVTAGTITADFLLSGSIKTANSGARVEMNDFGLFGFDAGNNVTYHLSNADGSTTINVTDQAPGSGLTVTSNGLTKFHTGVDQSILRDRNNNVIISDDVVAGWGFTQPNLSYNVAPNYTTINPLGGPTSGYSTMFTGLILVNNPRLILGAAALALGAMNAFFRVVITLDDSTQVQLGVQQINQGNIQTNVIIGPWGYNWPNNYFGRFARLDYQCSVVSGTSIQAVCYPWYCYGKGQ